jgi:PPM family protein phosphatase
MSELHLQYAAISDVGRVRKDNQDSGYAGPWLLAICDGVGGAARGDIASSTVIQQLRELDIRPTEEDLLARVSTTFHAAHDRIGELVAADPALSGTSTTATITLFDGQRAVVGHIGDSRAYLYRAGTLTQLTSDHTFVQTLIDEGRITEDEARTHPHKNLILKAVDGVHENDPDVFYLALADQDRLLVCSDGTGVLTDVQIADILTEGSPRYAAGELVRASLDAGSTDNVTCLVADVVERTNADTGQAPMVVGAAADAHRPGSRIGYAGRSRTAPLFRGPRGSDTTELSPVATEIPEEIGFAIDADPEQARYAPRPRPRLHWASRLLALTLGIGVIAMGLGLTQWWLQRQFYVGERDGTVMIFRGIEGQVLGHVLSRPYAETSLRVDDLNQLDAESVSQGMDPGSLDAAEKTVDHLHDELGGQDTLTVPDQTGAG